MNVPNGISFARFFSAARSSCVRRRENGGMRFGRGVAIGHIVRQVVDRSGRNDQQKTICYCAETFQGENSGVVANEG